MADARGGKRPRVAKRGAKGSRRRGSEDGGGSGGCDDSGMQVTWAAVKRLRLHKHGLVEPLEDVISVSRRVVGVQAQVLPWMAVSVWNRVPRGSTTDLQIDKVMFHDRVRPCAQLNQICKNQPDTSRCLSALAVIGQNLGIPANFAPFRDGGCATCDSGDACRRRVDTGREKRNQMGI